MGVISVIVLTLAVREFIVWYLRPTSKPQNRVNKNSSSGRLDQSLEDETDLCSSHTRLHVEEVIEDVQQIKQSVDRVQEEAKVVQLLEPHLDRVLSQSTSGLSKEKSAPVVSRCSSFSSGRNPPRVKIGAEGFDFTNIQALLLLAESIIPNADFDHFSDCRLITRTAVVNDLQTWIGDPLPPQNHLLWFKCSSDNRIHDTTKISKTTTAEFDPEPSCCEVGVMLVFSESPPSERCNTSLRFPTVARSLEELSMKMAADYSDSWDSTFDESEKLFDDESEELFTGTEHSSMNGEELVKDSRVYTLAFGWPI